MHELKVIQVTGKKLAREFLYFPVRLYKDEKNWIRPLDQDIERVFDPEKNKYFRHGDAIRWIIQDEGVTVGRIAAFYNKKVTAKYEQPTGGVGFFECVKSQKVANLLFDTAKQWLKENGMEAMDGPVNFGDRNEWWGLLVEGFYEPNYTMPYNFSWYQKLFENYGFQEYFRQFTYAKSLHDHNVHPDIENKALRIKRQKAISFRHARKSDLEKCAQDFRQVYNKAWAAFPGVSEMSQAQIMALLKKLKPIMDEQLLWFGYHNDEPISMFIMIPEMNQLFKHVNGKMHLLAKIKLLLMKTFAPPKKVLGLIFGVVPDFQGKGVDGAMVSAFREHVKRTRMKYDELEMNWIGDFNPKMIRVVEMVGGKVKKVHVTYRHLFDPNKPFKRAKIL